MQYCVKCRHISEDGAGKCQNCRSRKLRPAGAGDMAFLCKADMYAAGKVHDALVEAGIEPELVSAGSAYFNFDSETSPTDQNIFVPYETLDRAEKTAARAVQEVEREREPEDAESGGPGMKRIAGEVLSVLAFLVLIMLAVYGADGLANWLKGLMGMG